MRLDANIARVVRPEFGPRSSIPSAITVDCSASPHVFEINHLGQGQFTATCGAVSALMVLKALVGTEDPLHDIYSDSHAYDKDWTAKLANHSWPEGSSPIGIEDTLQSRVPVESDPKFEVLIRVDGELLTRSMCWALVTKQSPSISLVHGRDHWLVISGCKVNQLPRFQEDRDFHICYLYLQDPAFRVDQAEQFKDKPFFEALTFPEWRRTYLDSPAPPLPYLPTEKYANKFVAITYENTIVDESRGDSFEQFEDRISEFECPSGVIDNVLTTEALFNDPPWNQFRGRVKLLQVETGKRSHVAGSVLLRNVLRARGKCRRDVSNCAHLEN